jgi:hypothetical protein
VRFLSEAWNIMGAAFYECLGPDYRIWRNAVHAVMLPDNQSPALISCLVKPAPTVVGLLLHAIVSTTSPSNTIWSIGLVLEYLCSVSTRNVHGIPVPASFRFSPQGNCPFHCFCPFSKKKNSLYLHGRLDLCAKRIEAGCASSSIRPIATNQNFFFLYTIKNNI